MTELTEAQIERRLRTVASRVERLNAEIERHSAYIAAATDRPRCAGYADTARAAIEVAHRALNTVRSVQAAQAQAATISTQPAVDAAAEYEAWLNQRPAASGLNQRTSLTW